MVSNRHPTSNEKEAHYKYGGWTRRYYPPKNKLKQSLIKNYINI